MHTLSAKIEALLFQSGEPLARAQIAKLTGESLESVAAALAALEAGYRSREAGLAIITLKDSVTLGTEPSLSSFLETYLEREQERELGRASLEVLALVLYHSPITRVEINRIRGVDSSHLLRQLMIRGLISRTAGTEATRSTSYAPTMELLAHLGVRSLEELPDRERIISELKIYLMRSVAEDAENPTS